MGNGEAFKIHMSESTKKLLDILGGFEFSARGDGIQVKGKGLMQTYWLNCYSPGKGMEHGHAHGYQSRKNSMAAGYNISPYNTLSTFSRSNTDRVNRYNHSLQVDDSTIEPNSNPEEKHRNNDDSKLDHSPNNNDAISCPSTNQVLRRKNNSSHSRARKITDISSKRISMGREYYEAANHNLIQKDRKSSISHKFSIMTNATLGLDLMPNSPTGNGIGSGPITPVDQSQKGMGIEVLASPTTTSTQPKKI